MYTLINGKQEPMDDPNKILNNTISTVKHLAANDINNIPCIYLWWTETYLQAILDEGFDELPNIRGILEFIKKIKTQIQLSNVLLYNEIERQSAPTKRHINGQIGKYEYSHGKMITCCEESKDTIETHAKNVSSILSVFHQLKENSDSTLVFNKVNQENAIGGLKDNKFDKLILLRPVFGLWNPREIFDKLVYRSLLNI